MSKRSREDSESTECVHQRHKRLKDDNGDSQRVSPLRFDQTFRFGANGGAAMQDDPFQLSLTDHSDDDNDNKMNTNSRSTSLDANHSNHGDSEADFGILLYELASLNVGQESNPDDMQTCPICSARVSLRQFPDHVHRCLDAMDEGDRNDMRSQTEKDSDFAAEYAIRHNYVTDFTTKCPSCGETLILGSGMNEHVNECMDEMIRREEAKKNGVGVMDDEDEDSDIEGNPNGNSPKKVGPMSREQMIECASKLMTLQKGSREFDDMLGMFGALGFNKQNVKSVLEIEKQQQQKSQSQSQSGSSSPSKEYSNNGGRSRLGSIPEENVNDDYNRNDNHNRNVRSGPSMDFMIDDDDL